MDLDYTLDNGVFVLYTDSDTIYRSLTKPEHYAILQEAFDTVGITQDGFSVRMVGKKGDDFNEKVKEIETTFQGVKVQIK